MATEFVMTPGAWSAVRFAPSWPWETMLAIRTLTVRHHQAAHAPWLERVDRTALGAAAPALAALIPRRGWSPDFLTPVSAPGVVAFGAQLERVRTAPVASVATELRRSLASSPSRARAAVVGPLLDDPASARAVLADQLQAAFDLLIAPWAVRLEELLAAEVRRRSEVAATHGIAAAVDGVHATVTAQRGCVVSAGTDDVAVRCRQLVLMPSVFAWPYPVAILGPPTPALVYPAPGVATVWEEPLRAPEAVAALLGRGRADILASLAEPATTTEVAERRGLAVSTVSEHLAVLRGAGLVAAERHGRSVRYRRTTQGSLMFP